MPDFNTSLLREKFVIRDALPDKRGEARPVIALSNRLPLALSSRNGDVQENFVVRAQNMHGCVRMAARIAQEFAQVGPLTDRARPFDWVGAWEGINKGFESTYNELRWVAVYHRGRIVFEAGREHRHPFLDVIEQCDARNSAGYERAVSVAEDAFKQAGKLVTIEHDANVALVVTITPDEGKCGVIVRGPNHTTTFNFSARRKGDRLVQVSECLSLAAAFLEGIQLAFLVGMTRRKVQYELIGETSAEARKAEEAAQRLFRLRDAITQFETLLDVFYRPERPEFSKMIDDAGEFAKKVLSADVERRIQAGDADMNGWVA